MKTFNISGWIMKTYNISEMVMKTYNILLSAVATIVALSGMIPCEATASDDVQVESLELNRSITRRV